jgi:hypothetical protein
LLSALAALAALHPGEQIEGTILVQLPGASDEVLAEILRVVRELAAEHASIARIEGLVDRDTGADRLRRLLGGDFDEFYYAHDSTGDTCRRLAQLYPRARKVCTGDAFGMIYAADYVAGFQPAGSVMAALRRWLRGLAMPALRPDVAALVLPVDPSGNGLRGVQLMCCGKSDFLEAIRHCHANAAGLREYIASVLARYAARKRYLLLTETHAEAGHLSIEREAAMYAEIVRRHCEPGSVVLVKPHPLEMPGKAERIARALQGGYELAGVDAAFGRYPVEVWEALVRGCTVICSAYPVLSLKYAYDIDVVQPMDGAMIDRWIEPAHRRWSRDSLRLYTEPLARLPHWDGRSILWSGGTRG